MVVDVSEIKAFRHCKRQWQLSSRNSFHMTAVVPPKAFKLGTVFHECLHKLYMGRTVEDVCEYVNKELEYDDPKDRLMLLSMAKGYAEKVIPTDTRFKVMDIEWHFKYNLMELLDKKGTDFAIQMNLVEKLLDIELAGSIDMVALDTTTNEIWGFEHKTAKSFRKEVYSWMDEQPRVYYAVLQRWVEEYNKRQHEQWMVARESMYQDYCARWQSWDVDRRCAEPIEPEYPPEPIPVTLGGVYLNEVKKVVRSFDTKRTVLKYPEDDLRNFMLSFALSCAQCHDYAKNPKYPRLPTPDMMACMNCMFNTVCETVQYADLTENFMLKEFSLEFVKRDHDHLDEKEEIDNAGATQKKGDL